jgi:hypothetical protein
MSTPPAYWAPPLPNRQRPNANDAVLADKLGRLPSAPVLDFPLSRTPNLVTDRGYDLDQAATRPEIVDNGDLQKVRAVTWELHNAAGGGHLPRAAQLPPVAGLSPIGAAAPVPAVDVREAVPKPITIKRVPVSRPVPPLRERREGLSRPAKFLVAAAVGAPLACYVAIAGPYPIFGEAAPPELGSVHRPSLTVLPSPRAESPPALVNQNAVTGKADTALNSQDAAPPTEAGGRADGAGGRTAVQPRAHRAAEGNDVAATDDNRDRLIIADSGLRYLTRSELEELSRLAWYRPSAWIVPLNPVEDADTSLVQPVDAPVAPQNAAIRPSPSERDMRKDFTLADSGRQYLTREELQGLSPDQLVIARNEIFARKGRYFKEEALRDYFSQFSWYQPHAWDVTLSPVELANIELIQSVEQSLAGSRRTTGLGRAR